MHGSHAPRAAWTLRALIACLLALLAVAGPADATRGKAKKPKARAASVPAEFFGINGSGLWSKPPAERAALMARFKADGLSVVRMDVSWSGIEAKPPASDGTRSFRWDAVGGLLYSPS